MKNDIEALRGFANEVLNYSDSSVIDGFAIDFGLIDKNGYEKTEILTGNKDSISLAQKRLYFAWIDDVLKAKTEQFRGYTKEDLHWFFKERFLIPIFIRDDSEFAEMHHVYLDMYNHALTVYGFGSNKAELVKETFLGKLSITDATGNQPTEYLNCIEQFCHSQGVMLRTDSNLYKTAMGIK